MGVLNEFYVAFDNQMAVYYPGQMVRGNVVIDVKESFPVRGIRLEFYGHSYLHWSEGSDKHRRHYSARETYFKSVVLIYGKLPKDGSQEEEFTVGTHTFPFQYQLPPVLACSFEGDIGYVRYSVKAIIDRRWRIDPTSKRAFTIISLLDLNTVQNVLSGPISASFRLPRTGYVPGDAIPLYAEIENLSGRRMCKSYIEIIQRVHYHATTKTRTIKRQVAMVARPEIRPGGSDQWNGEVITVPPVPPSFLHGCNIIDIDYLVQLNVDPAGPALDLEVALPIIIGSIPHQTVFQQQQFTSRPPAAPVQQPSQDTSHPTRDDLYGPSLSGAPLAPSLPPTSIPNLPPPTYSESVFGKTSFLDSEDHRETQGDTTFAPRYTYYTWN
ncbi:hypothetical protein BaRGS_00032635 [Batillaria attramentaria]|uniref:Arrestin C-terminal-like domain-containing protein n=1 Tax=Batillaria attramentaria TaxID=370345 RepID=A0ABD0JML7_9CAEN